MTVHSAKCRVQNVALILCILHCALCIGCSIPNLESQECSEARDVAKQFFSFHFGNDMEPTAENIRLRQRFLTPGFFQEALSEASDNRIDPFTGTNPPPTTFKVGKCVSDSQEADFEVQFYWRNDNSTKQEPAILVLIRQDGKWLVNQIGRIP